MKYLLRYILFTRQVNSLFSFTSSIFFLLRWDLHLRHLPSISSTLDHRLLLTLQLHHSFWNEHSQHLLQDLQLVFLQHHDIVTLDHLSNDLVDHVPNNYYLCNVLIGAKCEPSSKTKARLAKLINLTAINKPKVFQEIGRKPKIVIKSNLPVSLDHRMLPFYYQIKDKHH